LRAIGAARNGSAAFLGTYVGTATDPPLRADWQAIEAGHDDLACSMFAFTGILDDDMGTLGREGDESSTRSSTTTRFLDFFFSRSDEPFVELDFMPSALSSSDQTIFTIGPMHPPRTTRMGRAH